MGYLVDEQRRLELLREQVRLLTETLGQEREERLAAQRKVEHLKNSTRPARAAQRKVEYLKNSTRPARAAQGKKNGRTNSTEG